MKTFSPRIIVVSALLLFSFSPTFAGYTTGNHFGEVQGLQYAIEYLNPLGITIVDSSGITFAPFHCCTMHENKILPEKYFGAYPLYFSDSTMHFRVLLHNTTNRTFRNLRAEAIQEYLNTDGRTGAEMSSEAMSSWFVEKLAPFEEITLMGSFKTPSSGESGIDQTHLRILHVGSNGSENGHDALFLDDPQAGFWCPV